MVKNTRKDTVKLRKKLSSTPSIRDFFSVVGRNRFMDGHHRSHQFLVGGNGVSAILSELIIIYRLLLYKNGSEREKMMVFLFSMAKKAENMGNSGEIITKK